tara:strand:+ start:197 stop:625 length:429 start_codon:yes stop_codon:yes gene_type:complete
MNDQEKMEAILASDPVSNHTLAKNLYRLMYGDLSSIGDAISEGKVILYNGGLALAQGISFASDATCYTIKQPTIMFNGCEINAPIDREDVDYDLDCLVWVVTTTGVHNILVEDVREKDYLCGLVFITEEDAQAYRKAAGWVL